MNSMDILLFFNKLSTSMTVHFWNNKGVDIPEQYLNDSTPAEFGKNLKLYAALMMFKSGKLSAGSAAEFAEVDRFRFAEACEHNGIPLIDYTAGNRSAPPGSAGVPPAKIAAKMAALPGKGRGGLNGYHCGGTPC